jgi:positive regulator of sigma E activity
VGAKVGDIVVLESDTKQILSMMVLVFVCPIVGVLLFYLLATLVSVSETVRALIAFSGLIFGSIGAFLYNRKLTKRDVPVVSIVSIENPLPRADS